MGCFPSKVKPRANNNTKTHSRARTATAKNKGNKPTISSIGVIKYKRSNSGRLVFNEEAIYKQTADRGVYPEQEVTRHLGKGKLGVTSKRKMAKKLDRLGSGRLYQDTQFPAKDESLFYNPNRIPRDVKWFSPKQLSESPKLLVEGISRDDIMQGALGDCWFLSACAVIAQNKKLMRKVIPDQQSLSGYGYKGVVRFCFWRFGKWVEVFVDDLLPTTRDKKLLFAHCADPNEFWVSMLEKAYAKLHGSYEAIEGGQSMDALVDLTGGIAERYEMKDGKDKDGNQVYEHLKKAVDKKGTFLTCSKEVWQAAVSSNKKVSYGTYKGNVPVKSTTGLIAGHAYSITGAEKVCTYIQSQQKVKYRGATENLVRVRNPWGAGQEWTGAWSDNDHHWNQIDPESLKRVQFKGKDDGEWWMAFKDFRAQFQEVTVCSLGPHFEDDESSEYSGESSKADIHMMLIHGQWVSGESAGGCRNDIRGFATNPQYLLTVFDKDDDEETCSIVIGLMQEHRRSQRHRGVEMLQIAFLVYETKNPEQHLDENFLSRTQEVGRSGTYVNFREVVARLELKPGYYIIIPSTYDRHQPGTFLIRVYSEKKIGLKLVEGRRVSRRR